MTIARTKLMLQDDLLRPRPMVQITYTGPEPSKLYKEIPNLMATAFKVHTGQIQEKKISWTKGETEKFSVLWEADKDLDNFSYYYIEVELSGSENKGYGTVKIAVKEANLRTEYPQDTVWERSLLYEVLRMVWHSMFYERKREQWIRNGRRMIANFVDEVKKITNERKED
ncbi:MAG: hypothetical protein V1887_01995 [Candidatus Aenigmatarchaeota archaeon]